MKLPNPRSNSGSTPLTIDWLRSNTKQDGECWLWLGSLNYKGYGQIHEPERTVHLVACRLSGRYRPEGMVADHRCRNRSCCNPYHIEFVTTGENTRRGASTKHAGGVCGNCGSTRLRKQRWGHSCDDCQKKREQAPHRKTKRSEYERRRASTPERQEQRRRALAKWADKRRASTAASKAGETYALAP